MDFTSRQIFSAPSQAAPISAAAHHRSSITYVYSAQNDTGVLLNPQAFPEHEQAGSANAYSGHSGLPSVIAGIGMGNQLQGTDYADASIEELLLGFKQSDEN